MIGNLPKEFLDQMKILLKDEYEDFIDSYQQDPHKGLRVNRLKLTRQQFSRLVPWQLSEVEWEEQGFHYQEEDRPGRHPYHEMGLYYIQEPSAMTAAGHLDVRPGERVLDLCAAPGGKSTQLAAAMDGHGLLLSNEPYPARARILSGNIERMGIRNAVVTNETPKRLAACFPCFFDKILIDAPCSGEGMFRKNPEAIREWTPEKVTECQERQKEILSDGVRMLKPGGRLVYSTCTFSPAENEEIVDWLIASYQDLEWKGSKRIWPHRDAGEGHFVAVFDKEGKADDTKGRTEKFLNDKVILEYWKTFSQDVLSGFEGKNLILFGEQLYQLPSAMIPLRGLKIVRPGLHLGTIKKKRFEPSHALALALTAPEVRQTLDLKGGGPKVRAYLRGETLAAAGLSGWVLVTVDGYPIGWGKASGGILKNHYPKGLRIP